MVSSTTTTTLSPESVRIQSNNDETRTVDELPYITAELNYWKPLNTAEYVLDFTLPGAENIMGTLEALDESHKVLIHNIRRAEKTFSLDVNGFQYAHHPVLGVKNWSDEAHVIEILLPETENLVKEM
jgi:hypothetical protein